MPVKLNTDYWILLIRSFIKDSIGASWQIIENKGKSRLGITFKDGTRTYTYLPYKWQRSNQGKIRDSNHKNIKTLNLNKTKKNCQNEIRHWTRFLFVDLLISYSNNR
tara:strand:- start:224 stop:544 length:321 start_codon:yes stop_codon:yes gene_type:complete